MPRLEFMFKTDFEKWIESGMDPARYECYVTTISEVILVPTVSTRPIKFAYYLAATMTEANELAALVEHKGVHVYRVRAFEWREEARLG